MEEEKGRQKALEEDLRTMKENHQAALKQLKEKEKAIVEDGSSTMRIFNYDWSCLYCACDLPCSSGDNGKARPLGFKTCARESSKGFEEIKATYIPAIGIPVLAISRRIMFMKRKGVQKQRLDPFSSGRWRGSLTGANTIFFFWGL